MPQTRTSCPRCRQPVMADINQLFDTNSDAEAKQKILSGQFNVIQCQSCGYQGVASTPLVYHDAEKELLLTFFPPEIGLPVTEQERVVGPLITQVMNKLPQEKRKAYLLRPQTMLSMQHMIERILEGDGITKEMIQDQQKKIELIRQLLTVSAESQEKILVDNESLIDETFFALFSRLMESAVMSQDQQTAQQLAGIQQLLLDKTKVGQQIKVQNEEAEGAMKALQEASKGGLTREKLADLFIAAKSDVAVATLVRLGRSGLDYAFFQILSGHIERAAGDEKIRLETLRGTLLKLSAEMDLELQEQASKIREVLEKVINSGNIEKTTEQILPAVNDLFIDVLRSELQAAKEKSDGDRLAKLERIVDVIQKASAPPPEYALLEKLLGGTNEEEMNAILSEHAAEVTPEFVQLLTGLISQSESHGEDPKVVEQLRAAHRLVLRFSMQSNMTK